MQVERSAGVIVGQLGFGIVLGGVVSSDNDEGARSGQPGLDRFDGINSSGAAVYAPVGAVGFVDVEKRGLLWAIRSAVR